MTGHRRTCPGGTLPRTIAVSLFEAGPTIIPAADASVSAELQLAFPTFTEAISMAAQKICRTLGIGRFPQVWSYLGAED